MWIKTDEWERVQQQISHINQAIDRSSAVANQNHRMIDDLRDRLKYSETVIDDLMKHLKIGKRVIPASPSKVEMYNIEEDDNAKA